MSTQPEALLYPKHSAQALGSDYIAHVMAMTREGLHYKSDIAVQLAWRDAELRRLHEANQELLEALKRLVGTPDDPNNGWRGTGGTSILFACEYCKAIHLDCTQVPHADDCPILQARAAIAKHGGAA